VSPSSVSLSDFGKTSGFYNRQLKTFGTISLAQSRAVDVDTKIPVGKIPHFDDMVSFFSEKSLQPQDRGTLIHGDYKIDNLVYHKTEPRVIGILDWEMATIGHPLSDLVNLTGPYSWMMTSAAPSVQSAQESIKIGHGTAQPKFAPGVVPGLPTLEQCVKWYAEAAGWDPAPDLGWGNAFGGFRGAVIMQGIAARYALRQASGKTAKEYAAQMKPYGEWAWGMVENLKKQKEAETKKSRRKARL
jgi:aminoglycoside phosphotransferase (APT) family kinase protein